MITVMAVEKGRLPNSVIKLCFLEYYARLRMKKRIFMQARLEIENNHRYHRYRIFGQFPSS